jgi:signal transduction histidine kinase
MNKFLKPDNIVPNSDEKRVAKLRDFHILDTASDVVFDTIAQIARDVLRTPSSFVSFVDRDRVFFKANLSSLPTNTVKREHSLCSYTILQQDITIIEDTLEADGLESPYVGVNGGIRFYAGAPIVTDDGHNIGSVCVTDDKPRKNLTFKQLDILKMLAKLALEKLESYRSTRSIISAYDDQIHRLAHDMKNPASSLVLYGQLMRKQPSNADRMMEFSRKIEAIGKNVEQTMDNLLSDASNANAAINLKFNKIAIAELLNKIAETFETSLNLKRQKLTIECLADGYVEIDRQRMTDVITNLVSNAIKYSFEQSEIKIISRTADNDIVIEFKDEGVGMTDEDISKLFTKFAKLSSVPTGNERSYGIGLYIVKVLTELHGGKVWASSRGRGMGSSFFLSLPRIRR